jgi:chromosome segregation ATPase
MENAKTVKELGNRILSLSDAQNAGEVQYVRKIRVLTEEVEALQSELVGLRASHAQRAAEADSGTPHVRLLDPDFNPSSPTFMHFFATVDLTDWQVRVKLIQTDAATAKQLVSGMITSMAKVLLTMRNRSKQLARSYARQVADVEHRSAKQGKLSEEVTKHYEEEVIPQLETKYQARIAKHKRFVQEREEQMELLKAEIEKKELEVRTAGHQQRRAENEVTVAAKKIKECEQTIAHLKQENRKQQETIQGQTRAIQRQADEIQRAETERIAISEDRTHALREIETLRQAYDEVTGKLEAAEAEIHEANIVLPQTHKALNEATHRADQLKQAQSALTVTVDQQKREIAELQRKLKKVQPALATAEQELKETRQNLVRQSEESADKDRRIEELMRDLEDERRKATKLESAYSEVKGVASAKSELAVTLEQASTKVKAQLEAAEEEVKKAQTEGKALRKQTSQQEAIIAKQKQELESLGRENTELKESLQQARSKTGEIEKELRKVTRTNDTNREQLSAAERENSDLKGQVRELTDELRDVRTNQQELKSENGQVSARVSELDSSLKKAERQRQASERKIAEQTEVIDKLTEEKNLAVAATKATEAELEKVTNQNTEFRTAFDEIKAYVPAKSRSLRHIGAAVKRLAAQTDIAQRIASLIDVPETGDLVAAVGSLREKAHTLEAIMETLGISDSQAAPSAVRRLRDDCEALKQEQDRILKMLKTDAKGDLSQTISFLVGKHAELEKQLASAADFLSHLFAAIAGPSSSPLHLTFPLKKSRTDNLLEIVGRIKNRGDLDRRQVEDVLERAKALGYTGEDCMEACEFIGNHIGEAQRQETLEQVNRELSEVRAAYQKEQELHAKEKASLKKKIAQSRSAIAQMQGNGSQREEELNEQIRELERKIRELSEALATERRVREELGRIGAGNSADSKYLRSKMTANELRLLTFVERIMQQEKEQQELLEKQKAVREALLGDPSLVSQGKT